MLWLKNVHMMWQLNNLSHILKLKFLFYFNLKKIGIFDPMTWRQLVHRSRDEIEQKILVLSSFCFMPMPSLGRGKIPSNLILKRQPK